MFLTKLPKYTDLVRASNTRVDAESGQRLQIVCWGNPPEMGFNESDPDKLKSFPLSFLTLKIAHWTIFLPIKACMKARIPLRKIHILKRAVSVACKYY